MSTPISWRTAMKLAEQHEVKQAEQHDNTAEALGKALSEIQIDDFKKDLPFYNSKMRVRATLADCNSRELNRIIDVATEMLEAVKAAEDRNNKVLRTHAFVKAKYMEDNLGCTSLNEFIEVLVRGKYED